MEESEHAASNAAFKVVKKTTGMNQWGGATTRTIWTKGCQKHEQEGSDKVYVILQHPKKDSFCYSGPSQDWPQNNKEQRLTYSAYYAGNCAKVGVFIHQCRWMGMSGECLWTGGIVDTTAAIIWKQNKMTMDTTMKDGHAGCGWAL